MTLEINEQKIWHKGYYLLFGAASLALMWYYLSNTLFYFTTPQQFPISSFERFPLTWLIFPVEVFSFCFSLYFVYTLLTDKRQDKAEPLLEKDKTKVAIVIPIYNEPKEIVERTVAACKTLIWKPGIQIYLLDDSTSNEDRKNILSIGRRYSCIVVRRHDREGYKAGNINYGIRHAVREKFFAIFDSDQAPLPEFLEECMDHFSDPKVGFVQVPQYFVGCSTLLQHTARIGTNIFYQAQCRSKARDAALPFCGTNAIIRTDVFKAIGGFTYYSSTEDIDLGIRMNDLGYTGVYVPKILVHGFAPPDYTSYSSQQYRWANGNLAILRESILKILGAQFSLRQQIHTFFTLGWWLIGMATFVYIAVLILSLIFGGTHHTWLPTSVLALLFMNVITGIGMIYVSLQGRIEGEKMRLSDALLQYSLITNSMFIYARAAFNALVLRRYAGFVRTSKTMSYSGWWHIRWNLHLPCICLPFSIISLFNAARANDLIQVRTYLPSSLWLLFYSALLASSMLFVGDKVSHVAPITSPSPSMQRSQLAKTFGSIQRA